MAKKPEPKPEPKPLTEQQITAINALIGGATQAEAAEAAGCERHTIGRWLRTDPQFVAQYNGLRYMVQDDNIERLRQLGGRAIAVLERLLDSPDEKAQMRAVGLILQGLGLDKIQPIAIEDSNQDVVAERMKMANLGAALILLRATMANDNLKK